MAPRPLVRDGFQDLFHSPPGVLFSVRSRYSPLSVSQEYVGLERGRPSFTHGFTSHALLRIPLGLASFAYGPLTLSGRPFQIVLLASSVLTAVLQPQGASSLVWPPPRSLAATNGISVISLPQGTEMFQFPRFASLSGYRGFSTVGCPIRTSRGHRFAAARPGFSQLGTSFFASESLTIHPSPQVLASSLLLTPPRFSRCQRCVVTRS